MTAVYQSSAAALNIQCDQGASFSLSATCYDDTGLLDLTNYSALMQIRNSPTYNGGVTPTVVYSLSTTDGQITLGGTAGTITLNITATNTASLPDGEYSYDLFIYQSGSYGGSYQTKMFGGLFTVNPRVTVVGTYRAISTYCLAGGNAAEIAIIPDLNTGGSYGFPIAPDYSYPVSPQLWGTSVVSLIYQGYIGTDTTQPLGYYVFILGSGDGYLIEQSYFSVLQFVDSFGITHTFNSAAASSYGLCPNSTQFEGCTYWAWQVTANPTSQPLGLYYDYITSSAAPFPASVTVIP